MHGQRGEFVEGGALWSHHCPGSDPATGELLAKIKFPVPTHDVMLLLGVGGVGGGGRAPHMTSCCFRGPDFSGSLSPKLY